MNPLQLTRRFTERSFLIDAARRGPCLYGFPVQKEEGTPRVP